MSRGLPPAGTARHTRQGSGSRVTFLDPVPASHRHGARTPVHTVVNEVAIAKGNNNPHHNPSRIIRTFKEIEIPKVVTSEKWYEEMDCGICSHILGAPQALVPCGHTFCGPCSWEWIRINRNYTCPHCRVEIQQAIPFVPNIVVDQIIERKLIALPDDVLREEMQIERNEKAESWKMLRASAAWKAQPKRSRGLDDFVFGLFDNSTAESQRLGEHRRRASRHLPELGAPIEGRRGGQGQSGHVPFNLGDLRRTDAEQDVIVHRAEVRRLRESLIREQAAILTRLEEEDDRLAAPVPLRAVTHDTEGRLPPLLARPALPSNPHPATRSPADPNRQTTPPSRDRNDAPRETSNVRRASGLRSSVFESRQARGRGSRDHPLVVLSDDE